MKNVMILAVIAAFLGLSTVRVEEPAAAPGTTAPGTTAPAAPTDAKKPADAHKSTAHHKDKTKKTTEAPKQ